MNGTYKYFFGAAAPFTGLALSLSQVKELFQLTSLAIGIAIGATTYIWMLRDRKNKKNRRNKDTH